MSAAVAFYQLLATVSFTLLGLRFVVVGLSHGPWRTDPLRHRYDLHVALHFLPPGASPTPRPPGIASDRARAPSPM